jgi:hypothetical protein
MHALGRFTNAGNNLNSARFFLCGQRRQALGGTNRSDERVREPVRADLYLLLGEMGRGGR